MTTSDRKHIVETLGKASLLLSKRFLLREGEIVASSQPIAAVVRPGIYFLISDGVVIYVGQSCDVHSRIVAHMREKAFDRVAFISCNPRHLNLLESLYIHLLQPPMNQGAPMSLKSLLDHASAQADAECDECASESPDCPTCGSKVSEAWNVSPWPPRYPHWRRRVG